MGRANRFSVLVVEDEFYDTILLDMGNRRLLPSLPNDVMHWLVQDFNEQYARYKSAQGRDEDLVEVVAAGTVEGAIDVFRQRGSRFDVVLIDVDLSRHPNSTDKGDHFAGFKVYREMCESHYHSGDLGKTLFIMYTGSPDVLRSLAHLVIREDNTYKIMSKIAMPVILAFGERADSDYELSSQLRRAELSGALSGGGGKLLIGLIEQHTAKTSREIIKKDPQARQRIKECIFRLEESFDTTQPAVRSTWWELRRIAVEGWQFQHLYPVDVAEIEEARDAKARTGRLTELKHKLFRGFRQRLKDLDSRLAGLHVTPSKPWSKVQPDLKKIIDEFSDLVDHHDHIHPYWGSLVTAANHTAPDDYNEWRSRHTAQVRECFFKDAYKEVFGEEPSADIEYLHQKQNASYFIWRDDFVQALKVINANAVYRGWRKAAQMVTEGENDQEFWFDFQTDVRAMSDNDIGAAERKCRQPYVPGPGRYEQLPELVRTVCDFYNGRVEIISSDGSAVTTLRISSNTDVARVAQTGEAEFSGTKYRIIWPKGYE